MTRGFAGRVRAYAVLGFYVKTTVCKRRQGWGMPSLSRRRAQRPARHMLIGQHRPTAACAGVPSAAASRPPPPNLI